MSEKVPNEVAEELKMKDYHFNFTVGTQDTLSEEEQKKISEHLLVHLNGFLMDMGFHLPSTQVINEWYESKGDN